MIDLNNIFDPETDLALLLLRLSFGFLMFLHGIPKFKGHKGTANFFKSMGIPFPKINAWISFVVETIGAVFIVFGLYTQIAAFLLIGNMAVAVYVQAVKEKITLINENGQSGWELPLMFLIAFFAIFLVGPGNYSLDQQIF